MYPKKLLLKDTGEISSPVFRVAIAIKPYPYLKASCVIKCPAGLFVDQMYKDSSLNKNFRWVQLP